MKITLKASLESLYHMASFVYCAFSYTSSPHYYVFVLRAGIEGDFQLIFQYHGGVFSNTLMAARELLIYITAGSDLFHK